MELTLHRVTSISRTVRHHHDFHVTEFRIIAEDGRDFHIELYVKGNEELPIIETSEIKVGPA